MSIQIQFELNLNLFKVLMSQCVAAQSIMLQDRHSREMFNVAWWRMKAYLLLDRHLSISNEEVSYNAVHAAYHKGYIMS